jgi:hypothetical protein
MPSRFELELPPEERAYIAKWRWRVIAGYALVLFSLTVIIAVKGNRPSDDTLAAERLLGPQCARWDRAARGAIAQLTQTGIGVDLRLAGSADERLRTARHQCQAGSQESACETYRSIVKDVPSFTAATAWVACTDVAERSGGKKEIP